MAILDSKNILLVGLKGDKGDKGDKGEKGDSGSIENINVTMEGWGKTTQASDTDVQYSAHKFLITPTKIKGSLTVHNTNTSTETTYNIPETDYADLIHFDDGAVLQLSHVEDYIEMRVFVGDVIPTYCMFVGIDISFYSTRTVYPADEALEILNSKVADLEQNGVGGGVTEITHLNWLNFKGNGGTDVIDFGWLRQDGEPQYIKGLIELQKIGESQSKTYHFYREGLGTIDFGDGKSISVYYSEPISDTDEVYSLIEVFANAQIVAYDISVTQSKVDNIADVVIDNENQILELSTKVGGFEAKIDGKLDKIPEETNANKIKVYTNEATLRYLATSNDRYGANNIPIIVGSSAGKSKIGGHLQTATPINDYHCTNKLYVDGIKEELLDKIEDYHYQGEWYEAEENYCNYDSFITTTKLPMPTKIKVTGFNVTYGEEMDEEAMELYYPYEARITSEQTFDITPDADGSFNITLNVIETTYTSFTDEGTSKNGSYTLNCQMKYMDENYKLEGSEYFDPTTAATYIYIGCEDGTNGSIQVSIYA